ncbi:PDR/VanB family oxidoreductase [Actinokineospora iranica]|uniref:Ferredoxin-NADP reductase n=2 Tax=Actinokineospora iranica TaxID=1271860 RepID=A0A1G6U2N7_9PSEU|nr:PDR/VanB family oxidoreductase [Actinokineospora iranica]SDD34805.1 Ferredoxin-NADP reductase [Actinokineospora iranica]
MPTSAGLMTLQVVAKRVEADDVASFVLAAPDGADLPEWVPGAHVDVEVAPGVLRQYSLCGDPAERARWRIAVLREDPGRGGSRRLHDEVGVGANLPVGLPRNNFPLVNAEEYVFVAGGIGITPLLPMIRAAHAAGASWSLHYGGKRRDRMAFLGELACYGDRVRVLPEDEHGLLPLADILAAAPARAQVYCCGPEPLLDAIERACAAGRADALRVERFAPRAVAAGPDSAFEVLAASSGKVVEVGAGQSVLDALTRAGIEMPSSCREGTCASCETPVLEGEVDHRDSVLSAQERAEGKVMMLCVSRARSPRLVLDI